MLQDKLIDYTLLSKACDYYTSKGYQQIEVPWMVSPQANDATFIGDNDLSFGLENGMRLICSAEQGFVQMLQDGKLEQNKKYFSVSPCFRGDQLDRTHSNWFMKLELFAQVDPVFFTCHHNFLTAFEMDAMHLFKSFGLGNRVLGSRIFYDTTNIGTDIIFQTDEPEQLELGSYGMRQIDGKWIVYGTGLALPRISLAIEWQDGEL